MHALRRDGSTYAFTGCMNHWLDGVFGTVRCASCGAVYGRHSIAVVGSRDEYWFVRCSCGACGTQGLGVVIVKHATLGPPPAVVAEVAFDGNDDRLHMDDVLEAHELLREYVGDVRGLFEQVSGR